jgi:hypothetical protein
VPEVTVGCRVTWKHIYRSNGTLATTEREGTCTGMQADRVEVKHRGQKSWVPRHLVRPLEAKLGK